MTDDRTRSHLSGLAEIVLDCQHAFTTARFWAVALGWQVRPYDDAEIARLSTLGLTPETDPAVAIDAPDGSLIMFCTEVPESKKVKNRMHLDVRVRDRAHFEELLSLGARVLSVDGGRRITADPEGNEFCLIDVPRDWPMSTEG